MPMSEMKVSVMHVFAAAHWLGGVACVLIDLFSGIETGELGVVLVAVGAVTNVKVWLGHMETRLAEREQSAFELGRDSMKVVR